MCNDRTENQGSSFSCSYFICSFTMSCLYQYLYKTRTYCFFQSLLFCSPGSELILLQILSRVWWEDEGSEAPTQAELTLTDTGLQRIGEGSKIQENLNPRLIQSGLKFCWKDKSYFPSPSLTRIRNGSLSQFSSFFVKLWELFSFVKWWWHSVLFYGKRKS